MSPGSLCCALLMLALRTPWRSMASGFRGSRSRLDAQDLVLGVALLVCVAAGGWLLSRLLPKRDRQGRYHRPAALFQELCRAHALDRPSRRLLKRIARAQGLTHPALLFVEPQRLASAINSCRSLEEQRLLESIRGTIFLAPEGLTQSREGAK